MSKYVLVDALSQFHMRYVVEVPDDVENPSDPTLYPITPKQYAADSVVAEDVREFSQNHLGETIVASREVTKEEILKICDEDNDYLSSWSDDMKMEKLVTEIGYDRKKDEADFAKKYNFDDHVPSEGC